MRPALRVALCPLGRGLFATRAYRPGDPIVVLRGPRIGRDDPVHLTPAGANLLQTGRRSYILPAPPGVFVNHSCDPNAGIVDDSRLVAIRDIAPDDEIRFDYSTTMDEDLWTMECRCGTPDCRGLVTDFRHLPTAVRERYLALGIVPGFIVRRWGRAG
jgi:hypothetical protein